LHIPDASGLTPQPTKKIDIVVSLACLGYSCAGAEIMTLALI